MCGKKKEFACFLSGNSNIYLRDLERHLSKINFWGKMGLVDCRLISHRTKSHVRVSAHYWCFWTVEGIEVRFQHFPIICLPWEMVAHLLRANSAPGPFLKQPPLSLLCRGWGCMFPIVQCFCRLGGIVNQQQRCDKRATSFYQTVAVWFSPASLLYVLVLALPVAVV